MIETVLATGSVETLHIGDRAVLPAEADLRPEVPAEAPSLDTLMADCERRAILDALDRAGGGRSRAARQLRISRSRLYRRMEALGIQPDAVHA